MNQNDLRVIKTRKNIEESFIRLLSTKDFSKITVQDILDEALINRSTFYKHYKDKYDVAEQLSDKINKILTENIERRFAAYDEKDIASYVKNLYFELSQKREIILCLFSIHTDTIHLYDDMSSCLKTSFAKSIIAENKDMDKTMLDYLSTLYASLVMTSIKWCLETNNYEKLEKHTATLLGTFLNYKNMLVK